MMEQYFSLEQANRALKLVQPIVEDIMAKRKKALGFMEEVKKLRAGNLISEELLHGKLDEAEKLLAEIEYHFEELQKIGCFLRDLDTGLVDFPILLKGKEAFLCWKLGESTLSFWHEKHSGFRGRKPLSQLTVR